jgi:short-subunit dehydrogenase
MSYRAHPADGMAWVTGASSGIGRAVAEGLALRGFKVALSARSTVELEHICAQLNAQHKQPVAFAYPCDVTNQADVEAVIARVETEHMPVALAFLNAGVAPYTTAEMLDPAAFSQAFSVNVMGVVYGLAPLLNRMQARGRGQIAVNGSVAGYGGLPKAAAYGASKAAVIYLCETLRLECTTLRKNGGADITIQLVNPGFIETPLTQKNDFPMPFMITAARAAIQICDGFAMGGFEINTPKRLAWLLKAVNLLPYPLYFSLVGWSTRTKKP